MMEELKEAAEVYEHSELLVYLPEPFELTPCSQVDRSH